MTELPAGDIAVLREALDDEYHAHATYSQVIADFGEVRPFSNIREAEARHISALLRLFARYRVPVPENTWPDRVERYSTLQQACEAGVESEIENAQMYDRLLAATGREDIRAVLTRLQEASQQRHLPAFRRAALRADHGPHGGGRGRGRGGQR
jgi:hypothetical protein